DTNEKSKQCSALSLAGVIAAAEKQVLNFLEGLRYA
ncbi:unnamed protein product, partial [marine sediment metagenome]